jgi:hypothetical protein
MVRPQNVCTSLGWMGVWRNHGGAGPYFFDLDAWEQAIAASVRALATP